MLPGICGILAGLLYRSNIFYIRRTKVSYIMFCFFFFDNVCLLYHPWIDVAMIIFKLLLINEAIYPQVTPWGSALSE